MFNKHTSDAGLLNKRSCLAQALDATKFSTTRNMILVCYLSLTLVFNKPMSSLQQSFWSHFAVLLSQTQMFYKPTTWANV
jgi:hypothetical protein